MRQPRDFTRGLWPAHRRDLGRGPLLARFCLGVVSYWVTSQTGVAPNVVLRLTSQSSPPDGYKSCSSNSKLGVRKISQTIPTHLKRLRQKIHDPQRIPAAYLRNDNRINAELAITLQSIEPGTFPAMQI